MKLSRPSGDSAPDPKRIFLSHLFAPAGSPQPRRAPPVAPTRSCRSRSRRLRRATAAQRPTPRHVAMSWAGRLKRVFAIDIERCRGCGGGLRVIARIEEPALIELPPYQYETMARASRPTPLVNTSVACSSRSLHMLPTSNRLDGQMRSELRPNVGCCRILSSSLLCSACIALHEEHAYAIFEIGTYRAVSRHAQAAASPHERIVIRQRNDLPVGDLRDAALAGLVAEWRQLRVSCDDSARTH